MNPDLVHFVVTVAFSFLVGLEVKTYRRHFRTDEVDDFFGTARTFTFVGILGYVFYRVDPHLTAYAVVLAGLTLLYALFYRRKLEKRRPGILLYLVMLCVYAFGPLTLSTPLWMPSLLFVLIVFLLNARRTIRKMTLGINAYEFETLGKMVLLSAVVLPLLPDEKIVAFLPLSPYRIWLAVVIVSAISYGGYLMQKYLFPNKGYFLAGIIGGSYSSTATTVVLSRKAVRTGPNPVLDAAIVAATSVMYLRLLVIAFVFNPAIGRSLLPPFAVLSLAGFLVSVLFFKTSADRAEGSDFVDRNPLELGTALVFAALFVIMMVVTRFVTKHYGSGGLEILSFVVGFTDIDPFVLSLLTGKYGVTATQVSAAVMIAAGSNNLLKAAYALWFGGAKNTWRPALVITLLGVATILRALWLEHII